MLAGVVTALASKLTDQWFGAPVELTTIAVFVFLCWAVLRLLDLAARSKPEPRPAKQPDTRESLELLDRKWDIRGKYATAILVGLTLFALVGMALYKLWLWLF